MFRVLAALLLLAGPCAAHEFTAGPLEIIHPVIALPYDTARTAAGYMAISNDGREADMLIGISIEGVSAAIHESREENGLSKMIRLDAVEIPAGDTVLFETGGLHVMLMGLAPHQFKPGDMVKATLVFEHEGEVPIAFMVQDGAGSGDAMDHMDHMAPTN